MKHGWEIKKLGDVCAFFSGYTPKGYELSNEGSIPYFKVSDMNHNENIKYLTHTSFFLKEGCKVYPKYAIVFPKNGAAIATNKKRILKQKSVVDLNTAVVITNKSIVYHEFLYLYLLNLDFRRYTRGGAVPTLDIAELKTKQISVPSLLEQEKIVAELDCLSGIIEKKKQQLKEYDALAQSIFYEMFGNPIDNEKGWEVKKLESIGKIITGNTPSTKDESNYSSSDYCFVKPSDISKENVSYIDSTEYYISNKAYQNSRKLPKGSVLTTCIGIIGKVGILGRDAICNQQINAIILNEDCVSQYIAYALFLIRNVLAEIANAPIVPIINKKEFSAVKIPLPPISEQQEFASKIEAIEKQKELIKQSIVETETLFNSRMDYYFN